MGTEVLMLRQRVQVRRQKRAQWQVYRWVGICAMLVIACLLLLGIVF